MTNVNFGKATSIFGALSILLLSLGFVPAAQAAPDTEKGAKSTIQAPRTVANKRPTAQQYLKIVSATSRSGLTRDTVGDLRIVVEVQNTSKLKQRFFLRPELPGIPGSVQPSRQLTIEPLETGTFTHTMRRLNPGDRMGRVEGVVKLMNETALVQLDSRSFTFRVQDRTRFEDLRVDAVKITGVRMTGHSIIGSVNFSVYFSNASRQIFGNPLYLVTELRTGRPATGTRSFTPASERVLQSGLQPGERRTQSVRKVWPRGDSRARPNLWHTLLVHIKAHGDGVYNNKMMYSFIIDNSGKVIASEVEYGDWPAVRH